VVVEVEASLSRPRLFISVFFFLPLTGGGDETAAIDTSGGEGVL